MATPAVPVPLNPNPVTPDDRVIATPGGTFYASAGGYTAASGEVAASTYMLEEYQDLTIDYKRVPRGSVNQYYGVELNLSSASATYNIDETYLISKITASYSRKKTYTNQGTPYMQNQRFGWNGVSAVDGVSYGTLDASTLGPAGTIYTTQPFYYRRPWDDNVDSEVERYVECTDYFVSANTTFGGYVYDQTQAESKKYKRFFIEEDDAFSHLSRGERQVGYGSGGAYDLVGPYNVNQETLTGILSYINGRAYKVKNTDLISIPPEVKTTGFRLGTLTAKRDQGIPEYDPNRHDYTGY